jgi:hypothetical protein
MSGASPQWQAGCRPPIEVAAALLLGVTLMQGTLKTMQHERNLLDLAMKRKPTPTIVGP